MFSVVPGVRLRRRRPLELVGVAEAAAVLGISKAALYARRRLALLGRGRVTFPEPVCVLACGPIWWASQIVAYQRAYELGSEQAAVEQSARDRDDVLRFEWVLRSLPISEEQ